jgi:hypothetical protein
MTSRPLFSSQHDSKLAWSMTAIPEMCRADFCAVDWRYTCLRVSESIRHKVGERIAIWTTYLRTHSCTQHGPTPQELLPCLGESTTDCTTQTKTSGKEDCTAATKNKRLERIGPPTSCDARGEVQHCINCSEDPDLSRRSRRPLPISQTELFPPSQIRTILPTSDMYPQIPSRTQLTKPV